MVADAIVFLLAIAGVHRANAQTFHVLHTFTSGADGAMPYAAPTVDAAGNIYGAAVAGGFTGNDCTSVGCGTIFKLTHRGSSWTFAPLYAFQGNTDGNEPYSAVTIGPNGSLYGTTLDGGTGVGTVYNLQPPANAPANALPRWNARVIYSFAGDADGEDPLYGSLVFDPAGNIYGTTSSGGLPCLGAGYCGTMFELSPSGDHWTKSSSFNFTGSNGGANPISSVVLDAAGNLYGTTPFTSINGVIFKLSRTQQGWAETTLYIFGFDVFPFGGVILGSPGVLYGATLNNVYELSLSGGLWHYSQLTGFSNTYGPYGNLVEDAAGNLYGTTCDDGVGFGSVFKLTRTQNEWAETDLYDFTGGADGNCPMSGVALDAHGNIFGTAVAGGMLSGCNAVGCGTVWEITP